ASPALRGTVLFLGRLDAVKKPEVFLDAIKQLEKEGVVVQAHVYGDPTPGREAYAKGLKEHYSSLNSVTFLPGVTHDKTPLLYQTHSLYVNATPSGSFDKTIGEAMAAGCIVIAMNEVLRGVLRDQLLVHSGEASAVAVSIQYALSLTDIERRELSAQARAYVERTHSLALLTKKLFGILTS
ncbi:MAG: glycosyltransferase, partial [Patescibacteria group bacterium]|nr:glycosyltransferase [Patescibacteria group bacterium]